MTIRMTRAQADALQRKLGKSPKPRSKKPQRRDARVDEISSFTVYVSPQEDNVNGLAGKHYHIAHARKVAMRVAVEEAVFGLDIPAFHKPCIVMATYYYNSKRGPDQSNLGKGLLDALQHVGIIPGDDPSSLLPWLPETVRDAKGVPRIEITIRDLRGLMKADVLKLYVDRLDRMLERYF